MTGSPTPPGDRAADGPASPGAPSAQAAPEAPNKPSRETSIAGQRPAGPEGGPEQGPPDAGVGEGAERDFEVRAVARLAWIALDDEEAAHLGEQLGRVVAWVEALGEPPAQDDSSPTSAASPSSSGAGTPSASTSGEEGGLGLAGTLENVLRPDIRRAAGVRMPGRSGRPGTGRLALDAAPQTDGDFFACPRVIE